MLFITCKYFVHVMAKNHVSDLLHGILCAVCDSQKYPWSINYIHFSHTALKLAYMDNLLIFPREVIRCFD